MPPAEEAWSLNHMTTGEVPPAVPLKQPWGRKGLDTTERLNRTETIAALLIGHTPIQNKKFF